MSSISKITSYLPDSRLAIQSAVSLGVPAMLIGYFSLTAAPATAAIVGGQVLMYRASSLASRCLESVAKCKMNRNLQKWCDEKIGTPEHADRLRAQEKIKECYAFRGSHLNLGGMGLTSLPADAFKNLTSLVELNLENNQISNLHPDLFKNLTNLAELGLNNNQISNLHQDLFKNLINLEELGLCGNHLSNLPRDLFNLPNTCTIDLTDCPFSNRVLAHIREIVSSQDYTGPIISHSIAQPRTFNQPIKNRLDELYNMIGMAKPNLDTLLNSSEASNLETWLNRLHDVADFMKRDEKTSILAKKMTEYLELAEKNKEFRELFFAIIADATTSCGDRVALSILHIGIAKRLSEVNLRDLKELSQLLTHGSWPISQLEKIAREKVEILKTTVRVFDEIEVYLGYPIKLQKILCLPIDITDMLFFSCSNISGQDLEDAYKEIVSNLTSKEKRCEYLARNDFWQKALQLNFPEEFKKAEEAQDDPYLYLTVSTQKKWEPEIFFDEEKKGYIAV
jgi:hypothetical protein